MSLTGYVVYRFMRKKKKFIFLVLFVKRAFFPVVKMYVGYNSNFMTLHVYLCVKLLITSSFRNCSSQIFYVNRFITS